MEDGEDKEEEESSLKLLPDSAISFVTRFNLSSDGNLVSAVEGPGERVGGSSMEGKPAAISNLLSDECFVSSTGGVGESAPRAFREDKLGTKRHE